MKLKNSPEEILTRTEGARFYCVDYRLTYQKCQCKVYRSVDTLPKGKSTPPKREKGHS